MKRAIKSPRIHTINHVANGTQDPDDKTTMNGIRINQAFISDSDDRTGIENDSQEKSQADLS